MATYLRFKGGALGGVVGASGCHCSITDWSDVDVKIKKETPLFLYHGEDDPMIPIEFAKLSYDQGLKDNGIDHAEWT
jgi:predicted esterase